MLDLRYPMGMMFALVGAMLAIYGLHTDPDFTKWIMSVPYLRIFATWGFFRSSGIYQAHSLGININLIWGVALMGFGLLVLGLARWATAREKK
jgi:hypothetical protein